MADAGAGLSTSHQRQIRSVKGLRVPLRESEDLRGSRVSVSLALQASHSFHQQVTVVAGSVQRGGSRKSTPGGRELYCRKPLPQLHLLLSMYNFVVWSGGLGRAWLAGAWLLLPCATCSLRTAFDQHAPDLSLKILALRGSCELFQPGHTSAAKQSGGR